MKKKQLKNITRTTILVFTIQIDLNFDNFMILWSTVQNVDLKLNIHKLKKMGEFFDAMDWDIPNDP